MLMYTKYLTEGHTVSGQEMLALIFSIDGINSILYRNRRDHMVHTEFIKSGSWEETRYPAAQQSSKVR